MSLVRWGVLAGFGVVAWTTAGCTSGSTLPGQLPDYDAATRPTQGDGAIEPHDAGHDSEPVMTPSDAVAPFDTSDLCTAAVANGPLVSETAQTGDEPAAAGGPIANGTYVLERIYYFLGDAEAGAGTGLEEQQTLVLSAGTYSWAQATADDAGGAAPATLTGGIFATSDATITFMQSCPAATPEPSTMYSYSADGSGLSIYTDSVILFYSAM